MLTKRVSPGRRRDVTAPPPPPPVDGYAPNPHLPLSHDVWRRWMSREGRPTPPSSQPGTPRAGSRKREALTAEAVNAALHGADAAACGAGLAEENVRLQQRIYGLEGEIVTLRHLPVEIAQLREKAALLEAQVAHARGLHEDAEMRLAALSAEYGYLKEKQSQGATPGHSHDLQRALDTAQERLRLSEAGDAEVQRRLETCLAELDGVLRVSLADAAAAALPIDDAAPTPASRFAEPLRRLAHGVRQCAAGAAGLKQRLEEVQETTVQWHEKAAAINTQHAEMQALKEGYQVEVRQTVAQRDAARDEILELCAKLAQRERDVAVLQEEVQRMAAEGDKSRAALYSPRPATPANAAPSEPAEAWELQASALRRELGYRKSELEKMEKRAADDEQARAAARADRAAALEEAARWQSRYEEARDEGETLAAQLQAARQRRFTSPPPPEDAATPGEEAGAVQALQREVDELRAAEEASRAAQGDLKALVENLREEAHAMRTAVEGAEERVRELEAADGASGGDALQQTIAGLEEMIASQNAVLEEQKGEVLRLTAAQAAGERSAQATVEQLTARLHEAARQLEGNADALNALEEALAAGRVREEELDAKASTLRASLEELTAVAAARCDELEAAESARDQGILRAEELERAVEDERAIAAAGAEAAKAELAAKALELEEVQSAAAAQLEAGWRLAAQLERGHQLTACVEDLTTKLAEALEERDARDAQVAELQRGLEAAEEEQGRQTSRADEADVRVRELMEQVEHLGACAAESAEKLAAQLAHGEGLAQQVHALREEAASERARAQRSDARADDLNASVKRLTANVSETGGKFESLLTEMEAKSAKIRAMDEELHAERARAAQNDALAQDLTESMARLTANHAEASANFEVVASDGEEKAGRIAHLELEVAEWRKRAADSEQNACELQAAYDEAAAERNALRGRCEGQDAAMHELHAEIAAKDVSLGALRNALDEKEAQLRGAEARVDSLRGEVEATVCTVDGQRRELQARAAEVEDMRSTLQAVEEHNEDRAMRLEDEGRKVTSLRELLAARDVELNAERAQLGESTHRLAELEQQLAGVKAALAELDAAVAERDRVIQQQRGEVVAARDASAGEVAGLKERLAAAEGALGAEQAQAGSHTRAVDDLREKLARAQERHAELDAQAKEDVSRLKGRVSELEQELRNAAAFSAEQQRAMTGTMTTLEEQLQRHNALHSDTHRQLVENRAELDGSTAKADQLARKLHEAEAQLAGADARLAEATARTADAETRVAAAEARVEDAQAEMAAAALDAEKAQAISEGAVAEARRQAAAAEERATEAEAVVKEAELRVGSVEARMEDAHAEMVAAEARLEDTMARLRDAEALAESREQNADAAMARMEEQDAEVGRLREEVVRAQQALGGAEGRAEAAGARVGELERLLEETDEALAAARGELRNAVTERRQEEELLRRDLDAAAAENADLRKQCDAASAGRQETDAYWQQRLDEQAQAQEHLELEMERLRVERDQMEYSADQAKQSLTEAADEMRKAMDNVERQTLEQRNESEKLAYLLAGAEDKVLSLQNALALLEQGAAKKDEEKGALKAELEERIAYLDAKLRRAMEDRAALTTARESEQRSMKEAIHMSQKRSSEAEHLSSDNETLREEVAQLTADLHVASTAKGELEQAHSTTNLQLRQTVQETEALRTALRQRQYAHEEEVRQLRARLQQSSAGPPAAESRGAGGRRDAAVAHVSCQTLDLPVNTAEVATQQAKLRAEFESKLRSIAFLANSRHLLVRDTYELIKDLGAVRAKAAIQLKMLAALKVDRRAAREQRDLQEHAKVTVEDLVRNEHAGRLIMDKYFSEWEKLHLGVGNRELTEEERADIFHVIARLHATQDEKEIIQQIATLLSQVERTRGTSPRREPRIQRSHSSGVARPRRSSSAKDHPRVSTHSQLSAFRHH